jgi:hypothetical protein
VVGIVPHKEKQVRASFAATYYNARRVYHLNGAPWLARKEAHLAHCPRGVWDDVDTTSQAILWLAAQGAGDFTAAMNQFRSELDGDTAAGSQFRALYTTT